MSEDIKEKDINEELLIELNKFYNKLLNSQEPLEEEFEKVLYDNLWDLYVRDGE